MVPVEHEGLQENTNDNPIHPSVPEEDFLANATPAPACSLSGECEACQ